MSAFSSVCDILPVPSRSTVTAASSGVEYESTKYFPSGDIVTLWFAFSASAASALAVESDLVEVLEVRIAALAPCPAP
jgi:hypothetical protein